MKRRTRKEQRQDSQDHYGGLAENTPDRKAIKKFKRPPAYQAGKLVVEQARQMERSGHGRIPRSSHGRRQRSSHKQR